MHHRANPFWCRRAGCKFAYHLHICTAGLAVAAVPPSNGATPPPLPTVRRPTHLRLQRVRRKSVLRRLLLSGCSTLEPTYPRPAQVAQRRTGPGGALGWAAHWDERTNDACVRPAKPKRTGLRAGHLGVLPEGLLATFLRGAIQSTSYSRVPAHFVRALRSPASHCKAPQPRRTPAAARGDTPKRRAANSPTKGKPPPPPCWPYCGKPRPPVGSSPPGFNMVASTGVCVRRRWPSLREHSGGACGWLGVSEHR